MIKAMIITVGGTPDPIIKTIRETKPDLIVFIVSEVTDRKSMPEIKESIAEEEVEYKKVVVDDPDDLDDCFNAARKASEIVENRKEYFKVTADPTGGTKLMTSALSMVSARKGYKFSYVSGEKRNKDGVGTVITGTEKVKFFNNPYRSYAILLRDNLLNLINHGQYEAAARLVDSDIKNISEGIKPIYECMRKICKGFSSWDSWDHEAALRIIERCKFEDIKLAAKKWNEEKITDYIMETEEIIKILEVIQKKSYRKQKGQETTIIPTEELICDLLANSRRRHREYKFDDAMVRMYRAIELKGRMELLKLGIDNSDVDLEKIPDDELRDKIKTNNYNSKEKKYKLGLWKTYEVLKSLNNESGKKYFDPEHLKHIRDILGKRNNSWLIHSNKKMKEEDFERLFKYALDFLEIEESDLPEFPKLDI